MELASATQTSIPNTAAPHGPVLGIWRLGRPIFQGDASEVSLAQPADAADSPRWDYVIKRAVGRNAESEGRQQTRRFIAAATATAHPNLIPVLDGSASSATPFVVMPRMEGATMARMMATHASQPLPVALWLIRQTAQGLHALHQAGWVHGDVKPANVIVGGNGHATLIDLSFAAQVHTPLGSVFRGSPGYAAPEQLEGRMAALPAMDVFALGRMLWEWLTNLDPVDPSLLDPVAAVVEAMLDADPARRPTAETVTKELLRLEIDSLGFHLGPSRSAA